MDLENQIRKHALANAVEHEGKAVVGSVIGKLLAENPSLRENVKDIQHLVVRIVSEVNNLSSDEQKAALEKTGYEKVEKKEERKPLELGRVEKVVVRFAPNPDGAIHLGNARPAVLSYEYAKKYKGTFYLRFEDTDPKVKKPEKRYYAWIKEDLKWLGIRWNKKVLIQSKRLKIYYSYAEKLVALGGTYVCTCGDEWKKLRDQSIACPCRELPVKEQQKRWKKMLTNRYKEGHAVLRVKTFLGAANPAVRDWPAMRIVDKPKHPLVKAHLWPLYNFASAIDDHVLEITHILRGQEHSTNEEKQKFLYRHFGWVYPKVIILGRFLTPEMVLSKSLIRKGIEEHKFSGWDDPKLGTLRALKRRGFQPSAIRQLILDIGPKSNDVTIAFENLAAYNKKIVDKTADRYFFVPRPKKIKVLNPKIKSVKLHLHPERKKGFRTFRVGDTFYIDAEDFEKFKGTEIRLIGLYNVMLDDACTITSTELKNIRKLQWVPESHIKVDMLTPQGMVSGYGEPTLKKVKIGNVVQFERVGFVRIEKKTAKKITAVFGHR